MIANYIEMLIVATLTLWAFLENAEGNDVFDNGQGICTKGYFQCQNETICVPQSSICDGKSDCPSGSDEIDCNDVHDNSYYDHMYKKRPAAEHDDIFGGNCSLSYIGPCECKVDDLFCAYKGYLRAPDDIPYENIKILDFTGNNFRTLSIDTVMYIPDTIEKLILAHCNITEIHSITFTHLANIKYLYLDNNHIHFFPPDVFSRYNKLESLSLMYNNITNVHPRALEFLQKLIELDLRGNRIEAIYMSVLEPLKKLSILFLQNNRIKFVGSGSFPKIPLQQLSLVGNRIMDLERGSFSNLTQLKSLFLSDNELAILRNGTFSNLEKLEALTLNKNRIRIIELSVFSDIINLESLNLEENLLRTLDPRIMDSLGNLKTIYFDRFEMCSSAPARNCYPKGDGISDQEHMLANPVLRTCVWVIGAIGCTGNIIVLLGRHFAPTTNVVHSLYLRNLALSDLLMGIYLFIIAGEDQFYRGVYLRYEYAWRHSYACMLCGFLSTLSCESSVLILTLVTWDRFISVTQPLARKQPSRKTAAATLLFLWCLAIVVALAPISSITQDYFGDEFYGNNGVCLSLHIHEPFAKGWEYSAAMFVFINTLALIFICYAYMRMINEIRASGVACRSTRQSQDRDRVAQRFGIIVLTDCLCWVPVVFVKLIALSGTPIPQDLYAWLAIFVLPINSALNPVLYTLTTTIFKKQMRKMVNTCCNNKKTDKQHTASESGFSLSFGVFPIGGSTKRIFSYRGTHSSSLTASKNSWRRSTAV